MQNNYCREDVYSTTTNLSVFSPHKFIQFQWNFVRMYFDGFSKRWWAEIFLGGSFSQDIIKKNPKNTILFREFHNVGVKSNHTAVFPTIF